MNSVYTSVIDGSYLYVAFFLSKKLHTIIQAPCLVLLVPLVLMALVLLPRGNLQTLGSGPCHAPGLCTLCTITPHALRDGPSYHVSNCASQGTSFSAAHESSELEVRIVLESRVISLQTPKLQFEWLVFVVPTRSIDVVLTMLQPIQGVAHLLMSCLL